MKGAKAELPPKTISNPKRTSTMISGASHHFFLDFKNAHKSFKNSIINPNR